MEKYTIYYDGNNGTATLSGIGQPKAKVAQYRYSKSRGKEEGTMVLKVSGHTYWSGMGLPRSYAPAEYQVYQILHVEDADVRSLERRIEAVRICQFPVKQ